MKVKMKLDLAGIKDWLLAHGEKVALAIVGLVFLLLAYSAISRETLDAAKQPDNLRQLSDRVGGHVSASKFDQTREGVQLVNYQERAKSKPLEVTSYAFEKPFDPPVTDPKAKRGVPEVLAPEELRVAAGFDVFEFSADGAGGGAERQPGQQAGQLKPQPWVCVTGLVPIHKQQQEFDRVFAQAIGGDPKRDVPLYFVPILERLEVDEAKGAKDDWKEVKPAAREFEDKWSPGSNEIVAAKFVDRNLTGRLANLYYNTWGEAVSHPKVLLISQEMQPVGAAPAAPAAAPPKAAADAGADDAAPPPAAPASRFGNNVRGELAPAKEEVAPAANQPEVLEHRLLRVFDYTVQPGKKYRYRVILGIVNPSFKAPVVYLKDPQTATVENLEGKPSAPTATVTVPDGSRLLAGSVEGGSRYGEPSSTVAVTAIDPQEGMQAGTELKNMRRGSLANAVHREVNVKDPRGGQVKKMTLDFKSNILVLDIFGGRTLPGKRRVPPLTTPGEILLLDGQGNMTVRNELDDRALFDESVVREEPPAAASSKSKTLLNSNSDAPERRKPDAAAPAARARRSAP